MNKSSAQVSETRFNQSKFSEARNQDACKMSGDNKTVIGLVLVSLTVRHGRPGGISGWTIKANFVRFDCLEFLE